MGNARSSWCPENKLPNPQSSLRQKLSPGPTVRRGPRESQAHSTTPLRTAQSGRRSVFLRNEPRKTFGMTGGQGSRVGGRNRGLYSPPFLRLMGSPWAGEQERRHVPYQVRKRILLHSSVLLVCGETGAEGTKGSFRILANSSEELISQDTQEKSSVTPAGFLSEEGTEPQRQRSCVRSGFPRAGPHLFRSYHLTNRHRGARRFAFLIVPLFAITTLSLLFSLCFT